MTITMTSIIPPNSSVAERDGSFYWGGKSRALCWSSFCVDPQFRPFREITAAVADGW